MLRVTPYTLPEHLAARRAAQRAESTTVLIAVATTIACFVAAAFLVPKITRIRREKQLMIDPTTVKGLPPDIALLGKLGTFRALAIDWAAIRAERLKEEGKVYEELELRETVCALAPRFPKMWAYAAWNMAYNISVGQYTPEARWQWVNNGIKILRDKGIQFNPKSVTLYKELAWIYWHKIGDFLDDEHWNYKRALAVEMERVLGPPPLAVNNQEFFDWFKHIVDAPRDLARFLKDNIDIATLRARLREVDLDADDSLLDFVARNLRHDLQITEVLQEKPSEDSLLTRRMQILTDEKVQPTLERLLAALRSNVLRTRYHMDVDWMYDLMVKQYGPLDWRNAFSHSLYWSSWGDKVTEGVAAGDVTDSMNNARFVFFSLQSLIARGRMTLTPDFDDPFNSHVELTPDTRLIPFLYDTYLRLGKKQFKDDPRFREGTPGPHFMTGFVSAMQNWIELLYLEGGEQNIKNAENYLAWLRENNPDPDGKTQVQYLVTVEEFVMGDILSQLRTHRAATAIINGFLFRGLKHFSVGEIATGMNAIGRARLCYEYWMNDTKVDYNDRRKLAPIAILLRDQTEQFLLAADVDAIAKVQLWRVLPLEQRQMVWDKLKAFFAKLCETRKPAWSVAVAFPEPAGMNEFRATGVQDRPESAQEGADRGKEKK
ncbi:MAG: hypothetical protein HY287_13715 [Planctomycetes bacterium]|nr:hypothetical protein [Planctomycetota bacterium]MBI3835380.1 hypothetical protein [Planctomycetota bacterium]